MARKTIFDIYNEVHANETTKEVIPVNEVQTQTAEEVKTVEEVKAVEEVKEQPKADTEILNQNNTLQSIINEEGSGENGV